MPSMTSSALRPNAFQVRLQFLLALAPERLELSHIALPTQ
jgi:hypothetical protein